MSENNSTHFLDLDAIEADVKEVVIKLNGEEHKLVPMSVEGWIANMKAVQALEAGVADLDKEIDAIISMVTRSFPSLTLEKLKALPLKTLNLILEFARKHNGETKADEEAKAEAAANPPAAPTSEPSTSATSSAA